MTTIRTTHIQALIRNGLALAQEVDGHPAEDGHMQAALEKAAADLRHAAEELTAERLAGRGWPQA